MTQQEMARVKRAVIRKYPIFASIALFKVPIEEDKSIGTAAVWGEKQDNGEIKLKGIKYSPEFFDNLSFEQQVFVLAHETCHIAFKHFIRCLDKPVKDVERKYQEYCSKVTDERLRKLEKIRLESKYNKIWNIATDACINAFLKKDGLDMPEGVIDKKTGRPMSFVNIEDGLYRRAELIYDALVKKEEEKEQLKEKQEKKQNNNNQEDMQESTSNSSVGGGLDDVDVDGYQGIDSHEEWATEPNKKSKDSQDKEDSENSEDAQKKFDDEEGQKEKVDEEKDDEKSKKTNKPKKSSFLDKIREKLGANKKPKQKDLDKIDEKENQNESGENQEDEPEHNLDEIPTDEASVFAENEKQLKKQSSKSLNQALNNITEEARCSHTKPVKPVLSWKQLLMRSVDEESERWGYRRASRYMPNARIEDITSEDRPTTEVVLDTSPSVSDTLLRGFLRQLVPLFKDSDIKVGCFGGSFYGFTELKSIKEVEEFKAKRGSGGTNFEAAVTAFTKEKGDKRINKIIFTDAEAGVIPTTKVDGILWIVFGNKMNFTPSSGKVIRVSEKDLNEMLSLTNFDLPKIKYIQSEEETPKLRR